MLGDGECSNESEGDGQDGAQSDEPLRLLLSRAHTCSSKPAGWSKVVVQRRRYGNGEDNQTEKNCASPGGHESARSARRSLVQVQKGAGDHEERGVMSAGGSLFCALHEMAALDLYHVLTMPAKCARAQKMHSRFTRAVMSPFSLPSCAMGAEASCDDGRGESQSNAKAICGRWP